MKTLNEILENYNTVDYSEIETAFEDMLNETCEPLEIGSLSYEAGYALRQIDPTAFRCEVTDFADADYSEHEGEYYLTADFDEAVNEFDDQEEEEEE